MPKESPEIGRFDEQQEELRSNLRSVGFYEEAEMNRILEEVGRLEVGQTYAGTDPEGLPFRITKDEEGFEFETDKDVS